jgi:folate-binding protein YgfZ
MRWSQWIRKLGSQKIMTGSATFDEQYEALRRGSGVVELTNWSSVTVTGADRQKFLHNFCTNDVNSLKPGHHCEAFFTNAKGRIIGHGLIDCRDDELVFIGPPNQAPLLIEHLDRYIIRDDVLLRDTTSELAYFYGATMPAIVAGRRIPCSEPAAPARGSASKPLLGRRGDRAPILECGTILEVGERDSAQIRQVIHEHGYMACHMAAFEALRIEAGTPLFGVDFDEDNLPQEVNRDRQAISFTKGCYLGQETVARIDALGHVNQKLIGVRFFGTDVPAAGAELKNRGAVVGRVTSAAYSPRLGSPLALAMVRRESNAAGTALESMQGNCEVISLPLEPADA